MNDSSIYFTKFDIKYTRKITFMISIFGLFFAASCFAPWSPGNHHSQFAAAPTQQLATGFRFTEGPVADRDGNVYFTDSHHGVIYLWSTDGELVKYHDNRILTVGLAVDRYNCLLVCEDNMILDESGKFIMYDGPCRRLVSIDQDGSKTVIVDSYGGKKLNGLNDIWIDPDGGIYMTDPDWGREGMEQGTSQVLYLTPDRSRLIRVIDDLAITNGVTGTRDGKVLYVIESKADQVYAYDVGEDGTLIGKRLFAEVGNDGMTVDEYGNLYVTDIGITIYAPDGKKLETITVPERPSNVCFGGPGGRTLYITARNSLYAVPMNVRGADWK